MAAPPHTGEDFLGFDDEEDFDPLESYDPDPENEPAMPAASGPDVAADAAALLKKATHSNGMLSTYDDDKTYKDRVHRARVAGDYQYLRKRAEDASEAAAVAQRNERTQGERYEELRNRSAEAEAEVERLTDLGKTQPNIGAQQAAHSRLADAFGAERAQAETMSRAVAAARAAEVERDAVLLELTHKRREHEGLEHTTHAEESMQQLAAPGRAARERAAAERIVKCARDAEERAKAAEHVRQQQAHSQLEQARAGHKRAVLSLRERVAKEREGADEIAEGYRQRNDERAVAVMELKESTAAISAQMRAANAKRAERQAEVERSRQAEKAAILAAGGNPYMVFRQREEDARLARERAKMERQLDANMTELQGTILQGYKEEAEKRDKAKTSREMIEAKAKAISSNGKAQANTKFMFENTKAKVTVIDPTSKLDHINPSQHMTVKSRPDWKMGLTTAEAGVDNLGMGSGNTKYGGKIVVDPDVVDYYAEKYPEVTAEMMAKAEVKVAKARAAGVPPGGHKTAIALPEPAAATVRLMAAEASARHEVVDELLEPEAEGLWESAVDGVEGPVRSSKGAKENAFGLRELSTLEKRYMAEAQARQKPNQIIPQVVGGKTWSGPAFICKPNVILFADFDVGKAYEIKFTLTNVSYTFNAFRPAALPDAVASFFELSHVPPGRMSAGVTADLFIKFSPKINQDIESEITFNTATGPMTVPLKATTKKAKIALATPTIDFGAVVMGETRRLPLTFVNGGALDCPLSISTLHATMPEDPPADGEATGGEEPAPLPPLFTFDAGVEQTVVKGYDTTTIMLTFAPRQPGDAATLFKLGYGPAQPDDEISVHGLGVAVPIYVERDTIDLLTCCYDGLYRESVVLHNRSKTALKVNVLVPRPLKGYLEFVPSTGFVQARSPFAVSLKLRANPDILKTCEQYITDEVLSIPISVSVPEQVLPVSFMLRAQLTDPTLRFERDGLEVSTLHFGACPLNASRTLELSIRNVSALPQRFGFLPLPKEIDVQPGDAIGTILPGETLVRRVLFSPTAEITHKITLTCRTSLNRTYHLKCVGTGIQPILTLSSVKLSLPPTVEGDTSFGDVTLTNSSKHETRTFEFAPPVGSCLKLAPKVGTLPPGESVRVRVEFTAPVNPDTSYAPHGRSGAGVPVVTEGEEGGEGGAVAAPEPSPDAEGGDEGPPDTAPVELLPGAVPSVADEPWTLLARPTVLCFVRAEGQPLDHAATLFLGVETPVVAVPMVLGSSGGVSSEVAFGSVPVGQTRMVSIAIISREDVPLQLTADPLEELGPFSLINALPLLPPRGAVEVPLRYLPMKQLPGRETLKLRAGGCTLSVALSGQGVSPTLRLLGPQPEPPPAGGTPIPGVSTPQIDPETGEPSKVKLGGEARRSYRSDSCVLVHCGDVLVGSEASKTVTIENKSAFAVGYTLKLLQAGHTNNGAAPAFDVSPTEAEIAGGATLTLTVRFAPDLASDGFWQLLEVSVPNQESAPHLLMLRGRSYESAGYVLAPEQHSQVGPSLLLAKARDTICLPTPALTGLPAAAPTDKRLIEVLLVPSGAAGAATATLLIGNCKALVPDPKAAGLEFSFEGLDDAASRRGFGVEPLKGVVKEGEQQAIKLSFTLKEEALAGTELGVIASFGVPQWAEVSLKCVLKGGTPPPAQPETIVLLKGYIAGRSR